MTNPYHTIVLCKSKGYMFAKSIFAEQSILRMQIANSAIHANATCLKRFFADARLEKKKSSHYCSYKNQIIFIYKYANHKLDE
jgi:hypothetical protein